MNINGDAIQEDNNYMIVENCYKLKNLATQYKSKVQILFDEQVKNAKSIQYSSGGEKMHRGYYCPSPTFDLVVGKCNRGKILSTNINKKISFEYYFDNQKRLIAVKHLPNNSEVIIYTKNGSLGFSFDMDKCLYCITECYYVGETIQSYTKCLYNSYTDSITSYEKEEYAYEDNLLQTTDSYTFLPNIQLLQHEKYIFEHDDEGYLKSYKIVEDANGIEKENLYWKYKIFQITQKRKI